MSAQAMISSGTVIAAGVPNEITLQRLEWLLRKLRRVIQDHSQEWMQRKKSYLAARAQRA